MLYQLGIRMQGTVALWLMRDYARRADHLVADLFRGAVALWASQRFARRDNHEVSCTVALYQSFLAAIAADQSKYALVQVQWEQAQLTREILAGLANPKTAPRPDLTIRIGMATLQVEAKVLRTEPRWARLYVEDGMVRFLDGRYAATSVPGIMIGYLQAGDLAVAVKGINEVLVAELAPPRSELLVLAGDLDARIQVHESRHPTVRLIHHMIDLRLPETTRVSRGAGAGNGDAWWRGGALRSYPRRGFDTMRRRGIATGVPRRDHAGL